MSQCPSRAEAPSSSANLRRSLGVIFMTEPSAEETAMNPTPISRTGVVVAAAAVTAGPALTSLPASADLGTPASRASGSVTRNPSPFPRLTDVRTGRHATFDRVVLDLHG